MRTVGCGKPIRVAGTNGGRMHCGGSLTHLDGRTTVEFCAACEEEHDPAPLPAWEPGWGEEDRAGEFGRGVEL